MKINKIVASAFALAAMTLGFTSCTNDGQDVDAKSNFQFEFVVNPGSLTEAQVQELNDSIDSKIYGQVGATHYPLYASRDYANTNYDKAISDDAEFLAIINPIADKFNVTDFTVNLQLQDADGNVLRADKTYAPTVERGSYSLGINVTAGALAASDASVLQAQIAALYSTTSLNSTQGYAIAQFITDNAAEIQALSNQFADEKKVDNFVPVITVQSGSEQVRTRSFAPVYTYTKKFEVTTKGSLTDDEVAKLEGDMTDLFDGVATVTYTRTQVSAVNEFNVNMNRKSKSVRENVINALASEFNKADFVVTAMLVNREGDIVSYEGEPVTYEFSPVLVQTAYTIKVSIEQGGLNETGLNALLAAIKTDVFGGQESYDLGNVSENYAKAQFNSFATSSNDAIVAYLQTYASTEYGKINDVKVILQLVDKSGNVVTTKEIVLQ